MCGRRSIACATRSEDKGLSHVSTAALVWAEGSLVRILFVALASISCMWSADFSRISGVVTDQSRGAIPDANAQIHATTDSTGQFSTSPLPPGTYVVNISKSGFESQSRSITLANQNRILTIALPLAKQTYSVTVESKPSHLDAATEAHQDAFTLDQSSFRVCPLRTATFSAL
jgi:hypothetical protein